MVFSSPSFNNYPYLSNLVQLYPTYSTAAIILKQISDIISFPLISLFKFLFHFKGTQAGNFYGGGLCKQGSTRHQKSIHT